MLECKVIAGWDVSQMCNIMEKTAIWYHTLFWTTVMMDSGHVWPVFLKTSNYSMKPFHWCMSEYF